MMAKNGESIKCVDVEMVIPTKMRVIQRYNQNQPPPPRKTEECERYKKKGYK